MTLIETETLALCECCGIMLANADESGCRDFYGHTHPRVTVPADTVLTDETDQPSRAFTCDGCGERQGAFAYRVWAVVLQPAVTEFAECPDCGGHWHDGGTGINRHGESYIWFQCERECSEGLASVDIVTEHDERWCVDRDESGSLALVVLRPA